MYYPNCTFSAIVLQINRTTSDENCTNTEEIVSNMILMYDNCTAVQAINTYLVQTTTDLYRILTNVLDANNQVENNNNMLNIPTDNDKQWCII